MDYLKKYWPHAFAVKKDDVKDLAIRILIYALAGWALPAIVGKLLGGIPVVGFIVGIACWAIVVYCTVGIVLALLKYFKIIK